MHSLNLYCCKLCRSHGIAFIKPAVVLLTLMLGLTCPLLAAPEDEAGKAAPDQAASAEASYTQTIEKRTADILAVLELKDAAATQRIHAAITNQYRALRAWQAANEDQLKSLARQSGEESKAKMAAIMATRQTLHDQFITRLKADLTPDQLDQVKDKMTYGKLQVTYDAYCQIVPGLTSEERTHMRELLTEARELAMDGGSANEKSAIFKKYKGKINTYLSSRGHDVAKAYKDWGNQQRQTPKTAGGPTNQFDAK